MPDYAIDPINRPYRMTSRCHRYERASGNWLRRGLGWASRGVVSLPGDDNGRLNVFGVDFGYVERRVQAPDQFGLGGCRLRVLGPGQPQMRGHPSGQACLVRRDQDDTVGPSRRVALRDEKPGKRAAQRRTTRTPKVVAQYPTPQIGGLADVQQPQRRVGPIRRTEEIRKDRRSRPPGVDAAAAADSLDGDIESERHVGQQSGGLLGSGTVGRGVAGSCSGSCHHR